MKYCFLSSLSPPLTIIEDVKFDYGNGVNSVRQWQDSLISSSFIVPSSQVKHHGSPSIFLKEDDDDGGSKCLISRRIQPEKSPNDS
ncbi:hypothetical protein GH714_034981 [Hevea brasiliensis]|uniref:Uncharacterized protein n=1 Tax=Hevea brasiliensis TaxID=3981 RepID=A0A6A6N6V5_HEVBR|nr:hypothetical protein GH714_034981 [Hevea brasiliensis]